MLLARGPRWFTTGETKRRERIPSLFAWRSGAREEFEVKDDRKAIAAGGGKSYAFVLDFNLLPRLAPPKKSTEESDLTPIELLPPSRRTVSE